MVVGKGVLILLLHLLAYSSTEARKVRCEKLTIQLCKHFDYNMTRLPNQLLHENQSEAALEVYQFWPLVKIGCSSMLRFFLCSVYAPVCDDSDKIFVPCRSVCKHVRKDCLQQMKTYGFKWPKKLHCDLFPKKKHNSLCLNKESDLTNNTLPTSSARTDNTPSNPNTTNPKTSTTNPIIMSSTTTKNPKCENITILLCQNLKYSMTRFPNRFLHENQEEAALEVHQFWPLVQINCSPMLKFFLCTLYAPVCHSTEKIFVPCRSVCKQARKGCLPLMKTYGFKWPEKLNCNLFPEKKDDSLCLDKEPHITTKTLPTSSAQTSVTLPEPSTTNPITSSTSTRKNPKCEDITIPECKNLSYNMTQFPNRFQHENQKDAAMKMNLLSYFIKSGCSPKFQFFLCSLYAPACNDTQLVPCRSVCKNAKRGCRRLVLRHGVKWPKELNCRLFPRRRDDRSCLLN